MTLRLKDLGPYRIERAEDYSEADPSYGEMIRILGSKPEPPFFRVPSHLYKYSEKELGLYLNNHKEIWKKLKGMRFKDVNGLNIDIHDAEVIVLIPLDRFSEVGEILPLVKKRGSGKLSPETIARRDALNAKRHTDKMGKIKPNSVITDLKGAIH